MLKNITSPFEFGPKRYQPDAVFTYGDHPQYMTNQRKMAMFVGIVALGLPLVMIFGATVGKACFHDSISHFYYTKYLGGVFIGMLVFIGVFLLAYSGANKSERFFATLAGVAAICVALFPTSEVGCEEKQLSVRVFADILRLDTVSPITPDLITAISFAQSSYASKVHFGSAGLLFAFLAYYSLMIFTRPIDGKNLSVDQAPSPAKKARNIVYVTSGGVILLCIAVLIWKTVCLDEGQLKIWNTYNATFWVEAIALWAFGASWVVKGRGFGFLWMDK